MRTVLKLYHEPCASGRIKRVVINRAGNTRLCYQRPTGRREFPFDMAEFEWMARPMEAAAKIRLAPIDFYVIGFDFLGHGHVTQPATRNNHRHGDNEDDESMLEHCDPPLLISKSYYCCSD